MWVYDERESTIPAIWLDFMYFGVRSWISLAGSPTIWQDFWPNSIQLGAGRIWPDGDILREN